MSNTTSTKNKNCKILTDPHPHQHQRVTEEAWLVKEKLRVEVENGQVGDLLRKNGALRKHYSMCKSGDLVCKNNSMRKNGALCKNDSMCKHYLCAKLVLLCA